MTAPSPAPLEDSARRLIVYAISDRRREVDDYIPHALRALRPYADRILAVVDGGLTPQSSASLEGVVDEILETERTPFHLKAYQAAIRHLGTRIEGYDEVLLAADTWYGPIRPFGPVFERMNATAVHFWAMTDRAAEVPNPFTHEGELAQHLQPHWFAARSPLISSAAWRAYWDALEVPDDFAPTALLHDSELTLAFRRAGFTDATAFPAEEYPTADPSLENADLLLDDGCPLLRRRPFADWPPFLDRHAIIGRWTMETARRHGYPAGLLLQNLARNVPPKVLNTDASLLEVLPDVETMYDRSAPLSLLVVAHIFYEEMTEEILQRADMLPERYDLVITTPNEAKARRIRERIEAVAHSALSVDIRVVDSNEGRDQSAFLIGCRDILLAGDHDLVVKIHSKRTVQDGLNVGEHFRIHQFTNLLHTPGYAANLVALFQREEGLGLVFPPMIHIGAAAMGRGWATNKDGFAIVAGALGVRVPLDDVSPLAPFGSMFVARPAALRLMLEHSWAYADFGGAHEYRDGSLAHILERMPAYAAGELGFHARTVINHDYMSLSHTALDFKLDQISATTIGYTNEQIEFLRRAGFMGDGQFRDLAMMYLRLNHPRLESRIRKILPAPRRRKSQGR
ncbi:rhamnosyltransferase [Microbacterium sp. AK009]|uniref:rhamnan synthesis F family protein n=1 Tax=Microbacterium sp. AK009 TaxID=2723068 RepID=UPI0015CA21D3|nr:rhamnan synthesis F family protein [Microbacterium sp. AK009]NYF15842.1 rhamnosyltransferase [Microbacterium sp. AK009]